MSPPLSGKEKAISHIVELKVTVTDRAALSAACSRLNLPSPQAGVHKLFTQSAEGLAVALPGWRYPAVFQLDAKKVQFDNYNGNWGDEKELHKLLQAYAVEKACIEARKKGYSVTEQPLSNGSIKLTIQVSGGAA